MAGRELVLGSAEVGQALLASGIAWGALIFVGVLTALLLVAAVVVWGSRD
jgi:hypothetical protein